MKTLNELSIKSFERGNHKTHLDVCKFLNIVLLLLESTTRVDNTFSGMNHTKNKVQKCMGEQLLNDSLVTFIEKGFFSSMLVY